MVSLIDIVRADMGSSEARWARMLLAIVKGSTVHLRFGSFICITLACNRLKSASASRARLLILIDLLRLDLVTNALTLKQFLDQSVLGATVDTDGDEILGGSFPQ